MQDLQALQRAFEVFADDCYKTSPLYEFLSRKVAKDDELLTLCQYKRPGQPPPNILFGAVHHLLLKGVDHPLRSFYPSVVKNPLPLTNSFAYFKDFCHMYKDNIVQLLQTKLVQTNEINRCAYLYPLFCHIYELVNKPLALIEIGTSAGLQLIWDEYSYSYSESGELFGRINSPVQLRSSIRDDKFPDLSWTIPPISERIGVDLHVNDVTKEEDYLWLLSLIWPEHHERRKLFKKAATLKSKHDIQLIEGDGIDLLEDLILLTSVSSIICLFHTHVANQFSKEQKSALLDKVAKIGQNRDIIHIYNNMYDMDLHIDWYINGVEERFVVGAVDGHGKWFMWNL